VIYLTSITFYFLFYTVVEYMITLICNASIDDDVVEVHDNADDDKRKFKSLLSFIIIPIFRLDVNITILV